MWTQPITKEACTNCLNLFIGTQRDSDSERNTGFDGTTRGGQIRRDFGCWQVKRFVGGDMTKSTRFSVLENKSNVTSLRLLPSKSTCELLTIQIISTKCYTPHHICLIIWRQIHSLLTGILPGWNKMNKYLKVKRKLRKQTRKKPKYLFCLFK